MQAAPATNASPKAARQYDLDWLRLFSMCAVFLYHVSMFLNDWGWHVKNVPTSHAAGGFSLLLGPWIMPLFFVISGVSTALAFRFRSGGACLNERALRLGLPLLLGIFLLSPPQVYIERVTNGQFSGSFWQWLPHYFEGMYGITGPAANFAWMGLHLWYLLLLFLFSVLTVPLLRALQGPGARRAAEVLGQVAQAPGGLLLFPLPVALFEVGLDYRTALGTHAMGGWMIWTYLALFLYGYFLFTTTGFQAAIRKWGPAAVVVAVTSLAMGSIWYLVAEFPPFGWTAPYVALVLLRVLAMWSSVVAGIYLAGRYLNEYRPALRYWNEALMPFYILHQPVIVILGFLIREWALPPVVKFALLVPVAFGIIMGLFHYVVRPVKPLRLLFGIK